MRRTCRCLFVLFPLVSLWPVLVPTAEAKESSVGEVRLSKAYFSPALGDEVEISFAVTQAGQVDVFMIDRDGFRVRAVTEKRKVRAGEQVTLRWDGKDDRGNIVPDEAWSLKIDHRKATARTSSDASNASSYFPADGPQRYFEPRPDYYDRRGGSMAYSLPKASRVHVQAGTVALNPATGKQDGPVLKTVVNRQPRLAGAVVENWSGFDESGKIYVPELSGFAYAIAATDCLKTPF